MANERRESRKVKLAKGFWIIALAVCSSCSAKVDRPGWETVSSMDTARSEIHAAVLDGKIYVAGGIGFFRTLASCEVFDIASKTWSACPDLPRPLHHVAMASDDKKIYASGGYSSLPFAHDQDPKLWTLKPGDPDWTELAVLPEAVGQHNMAYANDTLFLIGGDTLDGDSAKLWAYDESLKKWVQRKPMPTARNSMAVAVLNDEIWVIGGRSEALGPRIDVVEIYNPVSDSWRRSKPLPIGRGGHVAVALDGDIHVLGGETFEPNAVIDRHDIWNNKAAEWQIALAPTHARHGAAAALWSHKIYLIGGGSRPGFQTIFSVTGTTQIWPKKSCDNSAMSGNC